MKKGSFKLLIVFMIGVLALIGPLAPVSAATINSSTASNGLSERDLQAARIIIKHLETFVDSNGNKQIKVTDKKTLQRDLKSIKYPLNANQLEKAVERFNYYIVAENGKGIITDMTNDVTSKLKGTTSPDTQFTTYALTCSDVLGAISLIHSGSYAAAAYLLGVTGPAAVIVPVLVSTAYYLGSLLC